MDIQVFPPDALDTVFSVLRTALSTDRLQPRERRFLQTYATITGYALAPTDPPLIRAADVRIG